MEQHCDVRSELDSSVERLSLFSTLFAKKHSTKQTKIPQRDWLKLVGEKIRREQAGTVPTFFSVCANKVAKSKKGLSS